jgi:hypothetical protein
VVINKLRHFQTLGHRRQRHERTVGFERAVRGEHVHERLSAGPLDAAFAVLRTPFLDAGKIIV